MTSHLRSLGAKRCSFVMCPSGFNIRRATGTVKVRIIAMKGPVGIGRVIIVMGGGRRGLTTRVSATLGGLASSNAVTGLSRG